MADTEVLREDSTEDGDTRTQREYTADADGSDFGDGGYQEEQVQRRLDDVDEDSIITNAVERLKRMRNPDVPEDEWKNNPIEQYPEDLIVFVGMLGKSPREGYKRLYLTLQFNDYIEFTTNDVVVWRDIGDDTGGWMLWFRKGTNVLHVRQETVALQRGFLQGDMVGRNWLQPNASGWQAFAVQQSFGCGFTYMGCAGGSAGCNGGGSAGCNGGGSAGCNGGGSAGCNGGGGGWSMGFC